MQENGDERNFEKIKKLMAFMRDYSCPLTVFYIHLRTTDGKSHLSQSGLVLFRYEVLTAVVMNVAVFWDIAPCSPHVSRRFVETYRLHLQVRKSSDQKASMQQVASHA
jgi:hypothetical protein